MGSRVVLAMSGGVDSSVAAHLLKEQGHEVIGLFMRTGAHGDDLERRSKTCCSATDSLDARAVADRLGVELPSHPVHRDPHHAEAHDDVGRGGPVDASAGDEELLVDGAEQEEVEVAGPDELAEFVAVLQEQGLDQAVEGEEAADEEEELVLRPVRPACWSWPKIVS